MLAHEREAPDRPLLEALLAARCWGTAASRAAATRLLDRHAPWGADLGPGEAFLLEAPSAHQSTLFVEVLAGGEDRTLDAVGRPHGLSGPAVGDAALRAGRRIRAVLEDAPPPWPWLVAELRRRLGAVTTQDLLGDALARLGAGPGSRAALLAAWLAGPFRSVRGRPGWLARDPAALLARSARCVQADGGIRRLADVAEELADLELAAGMLVPWLQAFGAAVVHDLVVATAGPLADAVERLLDAHGTARSVPQLAEDLATGGRVVDEASLAATVRGRRFRQIEDGAVRLAAWGEPVARRPVRRRGHGSGARPPARAPGGEASPDRRRHSAPAGAGTGRLPPSPPAGDGPAGPAAGGQLWLWVRVDDAVLRGEEAAVPVELAEGLGLDAGSRRTFSCRWGPVALTCEGPQPTRGSLRAVARAAGARLGDTLLLGFSPTGDLAVEVREAAYPAPGGAAGTAEAAAPCPGPPPAADAMVLREAARPVGSEPGQPQTLFPDTTSQGAR